LTKVLTGKLNENLSHFSESLTRYAFQILLYVTFQSEERPFPFSPWPKDENGADAVLPEPAETKAEKSEDKGDDAASK
jgi:hypothetical protein